jgi:hypothetical protein
MDDNYHGQVMPSGALVVAIPIMVLSLISLWLSLLWFTMQHYHSERWGCTDSLKEIHDYSIGQNILTGDTDVGLMAIAVSISTTASIVQQCWFATHWLHDRTSEYEHAIEGSDRRNLAIGPLTDGPSLFCFWVQMYCYNVIAYVIHARRAKISQSLVCPAMLTILPGSLLFAGKIYLPTRHDATTLTG